MTAWLRAGAGPLAAALALVSAAVGQDVTKIDPVIEFRQKMPAEIDADEPFPVEIFVRNTGKGTAEAVTVTDVLGPHVTFVDADPSPAKGAGRLSWALGQLPAGSEQVIKVRLKAAATADPKFLHTIEVAYQGRGQNAHEGTVRQTALELTVIPPETVPVGIPVPIRITITNPGSTAARDVVLQSVLPDGLTHRAGHDLENALGVIEPGQSRTLNLTVTPKAVGDFGAQLKLHAKGAKTVETVAKVRATPALLSLSVTAPPAVEANKSALFEMVVGNDAADARKAAELVVTLPKEVIFVRATDRGIYDPVARTVTWDLGSVAPGERRAVVWNGIVKEPGKSSFAANLKSAGKEQTDLMCPVKAVPTDDPAPLKTDK
jgi:uncharacterized repeat protein (TIGR01451 family)